MLSAWWLRIVLARCQREGGDPERVYGYFLVSDPVVRRGRVSAPPLEFVRPRA
jgi:hypothetical protein